ARGRSGAAVAEPRDPGGPGDAVAGGAQGGRPPLRHRPPTLLLAPGAGSAHGDNEAPGAAHRDAGARPPASWPVRSVPARLRPLGNFTESHPPTHRIVTIPPYPRRPDSLGPGRGVDVGTTARARAGRRGRRRDPRPLRRDPRVGGLRSSGRARGTRGAGPHAELAAG